jgi:hypothetical protein
MIFTLNRKGDKKMKPTQIKIFALLALFAIAFSSCEKIEKDVPYPIKKMIRKDPSRYSEVIEYEYNNSNVYLFVESITISDGGSHLYDKKGNRICMPFGGIEGRSERNPDYTCLDFYEKAIEKRIVWQKKL